MRKIFALAFLVSVSIIVNAKPNSDSLSSLPFRIERFNVVEKSNKSVELNFTIAELFLAIEKYEIWKSTDNVNFTLVGFKNRTSTNPTSVAYQVMDVLTGAESKVAMVYYKIRQVAFDGTYSESHTITLKPKNAVTNTLNVWPNPVANVLNYSINVQQTSNLEMVIYNASGIVIHKENLQATKGNTSSFQVNVKNDMKAGSYILQIKQNGIVIDSKMFIKQ